MNRHPLDRVMILGLDGATFDLLGPWMDQGLLPNLKTIRDTGAWGELESTNPPTTPPAWTTCTTGLNPGRHGIFDFTISPLRDPTRPLVSSATVDGMKIWQVYERFGGRSIVVNVPITYPPEKINGCMISGMMTPSEESPFMHPADLKSRIKAVCGHYIPNIDIPKYDVTVESDAFRFLDDIAESFQRRREAVRYLMDSETWQFFMVVFIGMDRIQHLFYKYLIPGNPNFESPRGRRIRERVITEYQRMDDAVGEFASRLSDGETMFIVSDHGFGSTDGYFNANTWLLEQGFLAVHPVSYAKKRVFHMAQIMADQPLLKSILPEQFQSHLRRLIRRSRSTFHSARSDLASVIDWSRTSAFFASIPTQGIYLNLQPDNHSGVVCPGDETDTLKARIRDQLMTLKSPITGEKLVDQVWFREELFRGPHTEEAPHILFRLQNYSILGRQHLGASHWFTDCRSQPIGFHRSNGIFMAVGSKVKPGRYEGLRIIDITPTALYAGAIPIPNKLDGSIMTNIFMEDILKCQPITTFTSAESQSKSDGEVPYSDNDQDAIAKRLRSLGYLE